ncbi:MAG: hypothetical protein EPO32_10810 [Anaerolineae bacterium]|nr:MAG: hypothetical protein EPO32_10810 [Anaerolineae bacterium]
MGKTIVPPISHDRQQEELTAKAAWFKTLSVEERMDWLVEVTELALTFNPKLGDKKHVEPVEGRIRVLSQTQR